MLARSSSAASASRAGRAGDVIAREALTLAWDAIHGRLERIFRDMAMGWVQAGTILGDWAGRGLAREHLGLAGEAPRPDRPRTERERA